MTDLSSTLATDLAEQIMAAAFAGMTRDELRAGLAKVLGVEVSELPPDDVMRQIAAALQSPDPQAALRQLAQLP